MALDTNLPMQGQQLDTASPLMNLVEMTRQSRLDNAQLATSGIDLQNKKNLLAMQTLTAGAAGGQQSYDAAKAALKQSGVDVSGWAPDAATGQKQAQALQTALIPPAAMMNASIAQQLANDKMSEVNGEKAPPNTGPPFMQPQQQSGGAIPPIAANVPNQPSNPARGSLTASEAGIPTPPQEANVVTNGSVGGMPLSGAANTQLASAVNSPDITDLQQHYRDAHPEYQKTAQNIVNGAVQLQTMQGDPQAVQKFLDNPDNMHDQHNIDMRKMWMNDQTPDKAQFWQQNAIDVKAGQAMGIAPQGASQVPPPPVFTPPKPDPAKNQKANNDAYSQALDAHKAEFEAWKELPAVKQAQTAATTTGTSEATNIETDKKSLNILNANLPMLMGRLQAMREDSANASYGVGVSKEGDGWKQATHNQLADATATANSNLAQKSAQSVLPELGPALQAAGVRGNKFLENIANNAVGLDLAAPPAAKIKIIDGLSENYVNQIKAAAARLRAQGQDAPTDEQIDAQVKQIKESIPSASSGNIPTFSSPSDPAFKSLPAGSKFIDKDTGKTMVKH